MQVQHAIRHLIERGSLPREAVLSDESLEIVPDPNNTNNVILRSERDLLARVEAARKAFQTVKWSDLTTNERLLFRQQHERLHLKRLNNGDIFVRGKYGARCRRELLSAIYHAPGGIECFDLFKEYPSAQQDIINLLKDGKITNIATTLWATSKKMNQ